MAEHTVRPYQAAVALVSAARLGTTLVTLENPGARGIFITAQVTGAAGVGNISINVETDNIDGARSMLLNASTPGTATQNYAVFPGIGNGALSTQYQQNALLGQYVRIRFINASAVGGNEITFNASYIWIK
jgi:hypothetical protein